jgi:hypothetical protein
MVKSGKFILHALVIILLAASCEFSGKKDNLFDVSTFSGETTPAEVSDELGLKPDSAFTKVILGKEKYIQLYNELDSCEFRFAKNHLQEIIVHKPGYGFQSETIKNFGLPFQEPSELDSTAFIKWSNSYERLEVVNFYKVGSREDGRDTRYKIYFKMK